MAGEISDKIYGEDLRALVTSGHGSADVLIVLEAPEPQITFSGEGGLYRPQLAASDPDRVREIGERFETLLQDLIEAGIDTQPLQSAGTFAATMTVAEISRLAEHALVRGIWPNRRHVGVPEIGAQR